MEKLLWWISIGIVSFCVLALLGGYVVNETEKLRIERNCAAGRSR